MREQKTFAKRTAVLKSDKPNKKYFIVCEGEKTEQIYFNALKDLSDELNIKEGIEIVPIIRSYSEQGYSNPLKMTNCIMRNLEEKETHNYSYRTVFDSVMDYILENNIVSKTKVTKVILAREIQQGLLKGVKKLDDTVDNVEQVIDELDSLLTEFNIEYIVNDFEDIMDFSNISYIKDIDVVCIVADRDKNSFTEEQYDKIVKLCEVEKYKFCVTNPCFELWLLLHVDDLSSVDLNKLKENQKYPTGRTYVEELLRNKFPGYKKNKYDAYKLVRNLDVAIENVDGFAQDINTLKSHVGSNLGELLKEIRN